MMRVQSPSQRPRARLRACLRAAAGAAATLLLAACHSVGPNYSGPPKPETPLPARFKNARGDAGKWQLAEPKDAAARGSWWTIFRDPDLDHLEAAALANNQDLRLALARIEESRAQTRVAASDFYPHADFDGSYARARTSSNEPYQRGELVGASPFGGSSSSGGMSGGAASSGPVVITQQPLTRTYSLLRVPADLNWEVDLFGRVRRNYAAARATRQAIEADYQNVSLMVAANVASTYFNLRALDTEETVTNQTIHSRQDALGIAQERLGAGLTSQLDVFREQADLASNRADLAAVKRSRDEMENALATLVGQPASSFRLGKHDLSLGKVPVRIPAGLPSRLLERRPDVAEAERELAAANERIGVAVAAFFPRITITGAAGYESATVGDVLNPASRIWQIGPSISLPIFEGGRNTGNLRAAVAQYNQQVARYRSNVLTAFQDVENALSDLRHLAEQAQAQGQAVEAAERTLQLSSDQYRNGAVTFLDVADSERTLFTNQRTEVQLAGERMQATVQLIKALGGGWNN
jgi:multidrug efflux system outer membrane protein